MIVQVLVLSMIGSRSGLRAALSKEAALVDVGRLQQTRIKTDRQGHADHRLIGPHHQLQRKGVTDPAWAGPCQRNCAVPPTGAAVWVPPSNSAR